MFPVSVPMPFNPAAFTLILYIMDLSSLSYATSTLSLPFLAVSSKIFLFTLSAEYANAPPVTRALAASAVRACLLISLGV